MPAALRISCQGDATTECLSLTIYLSLYPCHQKKQFSLWVSVLHKRKCLT